MSNLGKDYNNSGFDKYLQNIKELASLYKEIESISNGDGNIDRLPELDKRANILKNSIKEYEAALREANSSLGAQDKNFDKLTNTASELSRYMNEYGTRIKRTTYLYDKFVELQKDVFGRKIGNNEEYECSGDLNLGYTSFRLEVSDMARTVAIGIQDSEKMRHLLTVPHFYCRCTCFIGELWCISANIIYVFANQSAFGV